MGDDVVISVENLGKKYRIEHQLKRQGYIALRDVIAHKMTAPFRWLRDRKRTSDLLRPTSTGASQEDFWALREISFEVKRGEVVGIIGRNGAGKSTLLKILSRITAPTEGRVRIKDRVASLLEVGTGFHPELTGRENIFLNGAILGMNRAEIKAKFDEIVAFAEVEKFLDTPVKRYSSGMYVRLAFAVAAHLEPEILIVDEVLAVGDTEFQKKCLGKMKDVASGGRTVLFVSHNLDAVAKLCTNALMLRSGKLNSSGSTQQVITEYLIQSRESRPSKSQPRGSKGLVVSLQLCSNEGVVVSGESTQIQLVCETAEECNLQELALIIESERGQRVGLIDFRLAGRPIVIRPNVEEIFTALIENIELVPGQYSAKLYASGDGLQQDIEMGDFEVLEKPNLSTLSLYHKEINGIVAFRGRVTRRAVAIQIETPKGLGSGKSR